MHDEKELSQQRQVRKQKQQQLLQQQYVPPQAQKREAIEANAQAQARLAAEASAATAAAAGCPATRRPYHVVMTAASGIYQEWQSRIAYYHYQKQAPPLGGLGGCCESRGVAGRDTTRGVNGV